MQDLAQVEFLRIVKRQSGKQISPALVKNQVPNGQPNEGYEHHSHQGHQDLVGPRGGTDPPDIQVGHSAGEARRDHHVRHVRDHPLHNERSIDDAKEGDNQVIQQHRPARHKPQVGIEGTANIGIRRPAEG